MKLKPCPFCGAFPALKENHSGSTFMVECVNQMCRLQVKSYARETEEAAIELWNTRAEESKAESSTTAPDSVNHPSHYETNGIECIDAMKASQGVDAVQDFCICNAFKYIWRHRRKNGAEDIKKAVWYLTKWLEFEGWGVKPNEGGVDSRL